VSQGEEELPADKHAQGDGRIGYRRPPVGTRFRPGQSGNPRDRPKGARNLSTIIAAALGEEVAVTKNGRRRRITKLEAAIKQLVNRAASGEARATQLLLALIQANEARRHGGADPPVGEGCPMNDFSMPEYQATLRADFCSFLVRCFAALNSDASFLPSWDIEVMAAKLQGYATVAFEGSSSTSRLAISSR
jgi:hypothetical protein